MNIKRIIAMAGAVLVAASGFVNTYAAGKSIGKSTPADTYITAKNWPEGPQVEAGSAVLMEAETGTVLYAKNPDTLMYPASITKIMTALLTLERYDLDDTITYSSKAYLGIPYGYVQIPVIDGEEMSVEASLHCLLLNSANDVANGLAYAVCDTLEEYSELMNKRAKELGAKNTHFTNPSGLEDDDHYTTAYDMCKIMQACVKYDAFNEIGGKRIYTLETDNKRREPYTFAAKHTMLFPSSSVYYPYVVSGKTGYTESALNTLVTYAQKDGMKLICCVMKCGKGVTYSDTKKLFDFGFENFNSVNVADTKSGNNLTDVGIFSSDVGMENKVELSVYGDSTVVMPSGVGFKKLDSEISYLEEDEDGCFAQIRYFYDGMQVGCAKLKMSEISKKDDKSVLARETAEGETLSQETEAVILNQTATTIDIRMLAVLAVVILLLIIGVIFVVLRRKDDRIHYRRRRR